MLVEPELVKRITDPKALRALAHPIRLSLLGLLRTQGPLTATRAAELLGESSASTSFHLRQLSKYGLAEEAGGGTGRERPWRATALYTSVPEVSDNPDFAVAADLYKSVVAERDFADFMTWLDLRAAEPAEWQEAATQNEMVCYLTPGELVALAEQVQRFLDLYADRLTSPERRPPGARLVKHIELAFPIDRHPRHGREDRS